MQACPCAAAPMGLLGGAGETELLLMDLDRAGHEDDLLGGLGDSLCGDSLFASPVQPKASRQGSGGAGGGVPAVAPGEQRQGQTALPERCFEALFGTHCFQAC